MRTHRRLTNTIALALLLLAPLPLHAQGVATADEIARWEPDIRALEEADRAHPPAKGGIVFTGSSSIRLWKSLGDDFPDLPVLNRGFGGSQIREVTAFVDRIVNRHAPRQVVIYCGGNDINAGLTAERLLADLQALVRAIHAANPKARIAWISVAPNPARWSQIDTVRAANRAVEEWMRGDPRLTYIDVYTHMLGPDGLPKPDIFVDDQLHMNANGYAIWKRVVGPYLLR